MSGPETIVIAMCIAMLGTGPLAALCNHLAMGAVPPEKAGSGAAIVQTTNEFGLGLGIATLGTLGTAVYRSDVEGAIGNIPPAIADAAREGIDRAVVAVGQLSAEQGGDLLAAARDAFTSGVHVVGIVSAILYAGLAVLALWTLKHIGGAHSGGAAMTIKETEPRREGSDA
jgi:DHA2 family multidrug resistance protein-like MFS transporter